MVQNTSSTRAGLTLNEFGYLWPHKMEYTVLTSLRTPGLSIGDIGTAIRDW